MSAQGRRQRIETETDSTGSHPTQTERKPARDRRRRDGRAGPPVRLLSVALFFAVTAAAMLSCGEEDGPSAVCPVYAVGAIEGRVTGAGEAVQAVIVARPLGSDLSPIFRTQTDSTGWYHLDLPSGAYWIGAEPIGIQFHPEYDSSDTTQIGTTVRRLDFAKSLVRMRLRVPPALNGSGFSVDLRERTALFMAFQQVEVRAGWVEATFPLVPEGTYRVSAAPSSYGALWLPGVTDALQAELFSVRNDRATVIDASYVDRWSSVSGVATGAWQDEGLPAPVVIAYHATDSVRVSAVMAAPDGSFTIHIFEAIPVKLLVGAVPPEDIGQWIGGETFERATIYDLHSGTHIEDVTCVDGVISCAFDGPGFRVDQRVGVRIEDEWGNVFESRGAHESPVRVGYLQPGRYWLRLQGRCYGETWAEHWYEGAATREEATPIDVVAGATTRITVHLEVGGRIRGLLLEADGQPVTDYASVRLLDADRRDPCQDGQGPRFDYEGLGDGTYYLGTWRDGAWYYPGTADPDSAGPIEIRDHATVQVEWRLPPLRNGRSGGSR